MSWNNDTYGLDIKTEDNMDHYVVIDTIYVETIYNVYKKENVKKFHLGPLPLWKIWKHGKRVVGPTPSA